MADKDFEFTVGLVLYRPEPALFDRIALLVERGLRIYLFDNSPDFTNRVHSGLQHSPGVTYMTAGKNVGLGFSMAVICATAWRDGARWLFFLDQDTGVTVPTLDYVGETISRHRRDPSGKYAALVFKSEASPAGRTGIVDTDFAISSGSAFDLAALDDIGWHNQKFFVDCVDYEFSLNARHKGYKLGVIYGTPGFDHVSEQPDRILHLFGKRLLVRPYAPSRIKDAVSGYARLIAACLARFKFRDAYLMTRSLGIYAAGQVIARVLKWTGA